MEIELACERPSKNIPLDNLSAAIKPKLVSPGDVVFQDENFMSGHGTYMEKEKQIASVAGFVSRVNRLVSVTALRQVYQGAVGDTVVGRVTQVQSIRWKVDVHSRLDADLQLANIQLPGAEQRRTTLEDDVVMRSLLQEGDLVCVEVQKISPDGLIRLAARSAKFGKLLQGTLVAVSPSLITQDKQRIHDLPCGARVIFGANGYLYVTPTPAQDNVSSYTTSFDEVPVDVRKTICRLHNCIKLLSYHSVMISPTSLMAAFDISVEQEYEVKDLLKALNMFDTAVATLHKLNELKLQ